MSELELIIPQLEDERTQENKITQRYWISVKK